MSSSGIDGRSWEARVRGEIQKAVLGQHATIERLLVALLSNGHVLLEGMPGLAKTLLVRSVATATGLDFERVQFTPDLLPSDVTGTLIFRPGDTDFSVHRGPIFANLVLADEINRAPAKVQSALLEAMQERQVTLGNQSYPLPDPFFVMATQNPIEQEGTYPLPEAQTDRFLFKLLVDYPTEEDEREIIRRWGAVSSEPELRAVTSAQELMAARKQVDAVHVAEEVEGYILALVRATRALAGRGDGTVASGASPLAFGASPRASLALVQAARAFAWLRGLDYVTPEHVQALVPDVLRHRIGLSFEAEADEMTPDQVLHSLVSQISIPPVA